jgi:hypothetical protein
MIRAASHGAGVRCGGRPRLARCSGGQRITEGNPGTFVGYPSTSKYRRETPELELIVEWI